MKQDHIRQGVVEKESEYLNLTAYQRAQLDERLTSFRYSSLGDAPLPSISAKEASSLQNQITAQNDRANWLTYGEMSLAATIFMLYMFPFREGAEERRQRQLLEQKLVGAAGAEASGATGEFITQG